MALVGLIVRNQLKLRTPLGITHIDAAMNHEVQTAAPLQRQQRRTSLLVERVLTISICFIILSLLKLEPLARNSVQTHNIKFDLPQTNHSGSVGIQHFQSSQVLSSSEISSNYLNRISLRDRHNVLDLSDGAVIASDESETDNTENVERGSESCLRPRRNSDAVVKSSLKLPCKIIFSVTFIRSVNCCHIYSISLS